MAFSHGSGRAALARPISTVWHMVDLSIGRIMDIEQSATIELEKPDFCMPSVHPELETSVRIIEAYKEPNEWE